jgi:hypothetical protein
MKQPNDPNADRANHIPEIVIIINVGDWDEEHDQTGTLLKRTNVLTGRICSFDDRPCQPTSAATPESDSANDQQPRVYTYDGDGNLIDEAKRNEKSEIPLPYYEYERPTGRYASQMSSQG